MLPPLGGTVPKLQTTPLPAAVWEALAQNGYVVVPNWLNALAVDQVRDDAMRCHEAGLPRQAGVGSTRTGATAVRHDEEVRRSAMLPLIPPPRPSAGCVNTRMALTEAMRGLCDEVQLAADLLDMPRLSPFSMELAYLYYPKGGRYLRHVDVPAHNGGWVRSGRSEADGGSFIGHATRREISVLLYLNRGWERSSGGELRIFPADAEHDSRSGEPSMEPSVDVLPEGGSLVLMRSDRVPHEVMPTWRERQCVVGWFRSERTKR